MCDSGGCSRPGAPAPAVSQEIQDITGLLNKGECFVLNEVSEEGRGARGEQHRRVRTFRDVLHENAVRTRASPGRTCSWVTTASSSARTPTVGHQDHRDTITMSSSPIHLSSRKHVINLS